MENSTNRVFNYIQEKIMSGEWAAGDKITPEIPLSIELGVSRSVVREAIKSFVTLDILSRVQGGGTYVNSTTSNIYFKDKIPNTHVESNGFLEILEVRKSLDPLIIKTAMEALNTNLLSDLLSVVDNMKKHKVLNKQFFDYVMEFQQKIADHSENDLLVKLYKIMMQLTKIYVSQSISTVKYNKNIIDKHEEILEKVKEELEGAEGVLCAANTFFKA